MASVHNDNGWAPDEPVLDPPSAISLFQLCEAPTFVLLPAPAPQQWQPQQGGEAARSVKVELDARVWRDASWGALRRKAPDHAAFLSGLMCSVRLKPCSAPPSAAPHATSGTVQQAVPPPSAAAAVVRRAAPHQQPQQAHGRSLPLSHPQQQLHAAPPPLSSSQPGGVVDGDAGGGVGQRAHAQEGQRLHGDGAAQMAQEQQQQQQQHEGGDGMPAGGLLLPPLEPPPPPQPATQPAHQQEQEPQQQEGEPLPDVPTQDSLESTGDATALQPRVTSPPTEPPPLPPPLPPALRFWRQQQPQQQQPSPQKQQAEAPPSSAWLHAHFHVDHVWVITLDCRMYQSATHLTSSGLVVSAEGPDWDAGECVDVVVRLVCRATQQAYLLRVTDQSVAVEVVFQPWELLTSLLALTLALAVRLALTHPAQAVAGACGRLWAAWRWRWRRGWARLRRAARAHAAHAGEVARLLLGDRSRALQARAHVATVARAGGQALAAARSSGSQAPRVSATTRRAA